MKKSLFTYKYRKKGKRKKFGEIIKSPQFLIAVGVLLALLIAFIITGKVLGNVAEKSRENHPSTEISTVE